jgi:c-di-GMP-binding flagellar brake protein YcgR
MDQRRRFVRLITDGDVSYVVKNGGDLTEQGVAQDISASGIRMVVSREIAKDEVLLLTIRIPGIEGALAVEGKVTWQRVITPQQRDTGIEFTRMDSATQDALINFIRVNTGMIEDRRAFIRYGLATSVSYRLETEPQVERFCSSIDVSSSGLKLQMPEKLEQGTRLQVSFRLPEEYGEVFAKCTVVAWARQGGQSLFETGVEFVEIDEKFRAKISSYIKKKLGISD